MNMESFEREEKISKSIDKNLEDGEDILASYNLMVSESEDEDETDKSLKSIRQKNQDYSPKPDFDEGADVGAINADDGGNDSDNEIFKKSLYKKISRIIDSESETECSKLNENEKHENLENKIINETFERNLGNKISTIVDSESESECSKLSESHDKVIQQNSLESLQIQEHNSFNFDKKISNLDNLESQLTKFSGIIDSDSDDELSYEKNEPLDSIATIKNKSSTKTKNKSHSSVNSIIQIRSGTQKMHRNQDIKIPYHKPRNLTLKEFMARKSIAKPQMQLNNFPLKMSENALKSYNGYLKERELESKEIFLSAENLTSYRRTDVESAVETKDTIFENIIVEKEQIVDYTSSQNKVWQLPESEIYQDHTDKNMLSNIQNSNIDDLELPKNINKESDNKVKIISNIKISPAIAVKELNIEYLKRLILNDNELNDRLVLKGSSGSTIDFGNCPSFISNNTEAQKSGVDELFEKFLKSNGSIGTSQNTNKYNSPTTITKDSRPGASYIELKTNLKRIINKNRLSNLGQKIQNFEKDMEIVGKICDEEENEDYGISSEDENDVNYINSANKIKGKGKCQIDDDEEVEPDSFKENVSTEDDEDADDESDNIHSKLYNTNFYKKKKQLKKSIELKSFDDNSDDEKSIDLRINEVDDSNDSILDFTIDNETDKISIKNLYEDEQNLDDDELIELCSGNFEKTQVPSQHYLKRNKMLNNEVVHQSNKSVDVNSPRWDTLSQAERAEDQLVLETSDEEEKITKELKKNRKICYSDDEVEFANSSQLKKSEDEMCSVSDNLPIFSKEVIAEYKSHDSQSSIDSSNINNNSNELNNKKRFNINDYIENEAELSESDWDSADEDERNLDNYDLEMGDEDEFDQEKLKDELAKIHMTKLMDRDASEIKKIEKMLFVDEENQGLVRKKQFKWKTANDDLTLDSYNPQQETVVIEEEDDEEQWRKMKHDREILLIEKKQNENPSLENNSLVDTTQIISIKKQKQLSKIENGEDSSFLISKSLTNSVRGSFLKRDGHSLSRVAKMFTHTPDLMDSDIVQTKTKTSNKFVFAQCTKFLENKKRKSSSFECNKSKKTKLNNSMKSNLIDQLEL